MNRPDVIPGPLSVDLRNTAQCRSIAESICEFENSVFGPDFACPTNSVQQWFDSGSLFCAAICGEAVTGRTRILSITSALLTDETSRDRMLAGEIIDSDLTPWNAAPPNAKPSIYFASVISDNGSHLASLYESLGNDMERFLIEQNLEVQSAFAIASGPAGFFHLERNGFQSAPVGLYLGRYKLMQLAYPSAKTWFWQRLLQPSPLRLRQRDSLRSGPTEVSAPALVLDPNRTDAREVERRLAQSKIERLQQNNSSQSF